MKAIHGTESSISKFKDILKRHAVIDSVKPVDSIYGIPFVIHETEELAVKLAWQQAADQQCVVALVYQEKYIIIDGAIASAFLNTPKLEPMVFSSPHDPIFKVQA